MDLKGKVAIVTGGARGIGKETALFFAEKGCKVVICSRTANELRQTEREINKIGECLAIRADVRKKADAQKVVSAAIKRLGKIDFLINNAGVARRKLFLDTTEEEWDLIIDTNLKGIYLFTVAALPHMIKQKSGVIVNVSSGAGKSGFEELAAYCASKFGVLGLTESVAKEVGQYGIKVYAVCPGAVDTRMIAENYPELPKATLISPRKIAKKIVSLCTSSWRPSGSSVNVYF